MLGTIALFLVLAIARRPLAAPPIWQTIGLGFVQTAGLTMFQTLALATGGAGKTTILVYTMPFFIVVFAAIFLGEKITRTRALAVALAAIGLGFVLVPIDFGNGLISKIFALCAAMSWGLGSVWTKKFRETHDVDLLGFTAWQLLFGAIPLVIAALIVPHQYIHITTSFVLAMAYIVIAGTALAFLLWFFIIERLSAAGAGISSLLAPVVSVFFAWLQLHENPSRTELIGIAFILCALLVNSVPIETWRSLLRRPVTAEN